jgi:hypothetical protein
MADEDEQIDSPAEPEGQAAWPGAKPKQAAFLTALIFHGGQIGKAAKSAKVARASHYHWMRDAEYTALYELAMAQVVGVLEDEAIRRAKEGVEKTVYYQGFPCGTEMQYSDAILMFLLKAAAPEKYRERSEVKAEVDVTHKFEGTMEELLATYRKLTSTAPVE